MLNFVSEVVRYFTISDQCVRAAFIRYSHDADTAIQLGQYSDVFSLMQKIRQIGLLGGHSNLAPALHLLRTVVFARDRVRSNAVRVAIIITDQLRTNAHIHAEAEKVRSQNIRLVAVAITGLDRVDVSFLNTMTDQVIQVAEYSGLVSDARDFIVERYACSSLTTTTPRPPFLRSTTSAATGES